VRNIYLNKALGSPNSEGQSAGLENLISTLKGTRDHIDAFQSTIARTPPMTAKYRRAARQTARVLGEFIAELSVSIDEAERILNDLRGENGGDGVLKSV